MKKKSYKEQENEQARGKRRYLERLIQDEEAAKEIDEYEEEQEDELIEDDFQNTIRS